MTRTPCYDGIRGLRKGTWTAEEDSKLIAYVTTYGHWNWRLLPKFAGLERCGKSCRLRWMNYLRPNIKRGNYTQEEEETIIKLREKLGNRYCFPCSPLHHSLANNGNLSKSCGVKAFCNHHPPTL